MRASASLLSLALLLTACGEPRGDFGFRTSAVELQVGYQRIQAHLEQQLSLSPEARRALTSGVPLTVTVDVELRDARTLTLLAEHPFRYVIRYLPLSEHFQVTKPAGGGVLTFPRLRHVLAELAELDLEFTTGALAPGDYEIRTRTRLDHGRMPAPMRLPALLSTRWRHNSEWSTWPLVVNA